MDKIRVIVIGAGMIAKEHLKCLKTLHDVDVVGVCDLSPAKAQATAERFAIPNWNTNYNDLTVQVRPSLAHITTCPNSHFSIAEDLLNSGVSTFIEKPITNNYAEFLSLKELASKAGLLLLENQNYQFNPPVQKVLKLIKNGELGEIVHVDINLSLNLASHRSRSDPLDFKLPGGIISDFLTHLANLSYIFIGPHRQLYTSWNKMNPTLPFPYDEFRALVEGKQGTAFITFSGNTQPDGFWLSVHGTKMKASINLFENHLIINKIRNLPGPLNHFINGMNESKMTFGQSFKSLWNKLKGNPAGYSGLKHLIKSTYQSIRENKTPPITLEQIDGVNKLVSDLTQNIQTNIRS